MGDAGFALGMEYTPANCADRVIEGLSRLKPARKAVAGAQATAGHHCP
jgi:hypothetical protein